MNTRVITDRCQCMPLEITELTPRQRPHRKFTAEEDDKLSKLVEELGRRWQDIAARMENRNARQCKDRWRNYLSPDVNGDQRWTPEEDTTLGKLYEEHGNHWVSISKKMTTGRTSEQVKNRICKLKRLDYKEQVTALRSQLGDGAMVNMNHRRRVIETVDQSRDMIDPAQQIELSEPECDSDYGYCEFFSQWEGVFE